MAKGEVWINMTTAPRDQVESCFVSEREKILARIIALRNDFESYNENRFPDNPIEIDLHFDIRVDYIFSRPDAEKTPLINRAHELLDRCED